MVRASLSKPKAYGRENDRFFPQLRWKLFRTLLEQASGATYLWIVDLRRAHQSHFSCVPIIDGGCLFKSGDTHNDEAGANTL